MYKKGRLLIFALVVFTSLKAQQPAVYPTHWWAGMAWNKVELLIHGENISRFNSATTIYPGVKISRFTKAESPNYLVVTLNISPSAKPGTLRINLTDGKNAMAVPFELKQRRANRGSGFAQGVSSSDLVYLIMPDRFANGNPENDRINGYLDTICNRKNPSAHHGGDIQGVINHLPYLKDLGVTSVWMCPVTENDMPWKEEPGGAISGYHGYWMTNHYEIDQRYGGKTAYKKLTEEAHHNNMKVIQDAVYNHVGSEHFLFKDKPFAAMFNNWPAYTGSNHKEEVLFSKYSSAADKKVMLEGWFTPHLPDLNLANPYMANFIIQNTIWCTEEFGVDAWRVDTYKYCDEPFLNRINDALLKEYPALTVFGEAWTTTVTGSAYFTRNNMNVPFKHNLQGVTDFPMQSAMLAAINQPYGWTEGVNRLMNTMAQDVLYQNPQRNCIFLDNHDMDRFTTMVGGDMKKYKMGMGLLLTLRGIPQLYFGDEIFLKNDNVNGDGKKRNDFPGGFTGDGADKFTAAGRSMEENEAFNYVKALANFRKSSKALTTGQTHDFLPADGIYVYFRSSGNERVMCVINTNSTASRLATARFSEATKGFATAKDVVTGKEEIPGRDWELAPQSMMILSLR